MMRRYVDNILGYLEWSALRASHRFREYMENPKLYFMHIPKTGGTSVKSGLRKNRKSWYDGHVDARKTRSIIRSVSSAEMSREEYFRELFKLRQSFAVYYLQAKKPIISGHIPTPEFFISEYPEYRFFTIVRNPIDRWISDYRYSYEIGSLDTFFDGSPPENPIDGVSNALKSKAGKPQRSVFTNYFSGSGWGEEGLGSDESKVRAIENVRLYDKIFHISGIKRAEEYIRCNSLVNIKIRKINKTSSKDELGVYLKRYLGRKKVRKEIRSALQSDMEVYEAARERAVT